MDQATKALSLAGLLQQQQTRQAQAEEAKRKALLMQQYQAGLRPDMTPEEQVAHATRFVTDPKDVLHYAGQSLDRKSQMALAQKNAEEMRKQRLHEIELRGNEAIERIHEQAAQNRITKEEADRREATTREFMLRLGASLRPAPQPRPLQLTTDAEGNQLIVNPDGTTTPLVGPSGAGGVRKAVGTDKPMTEFQGKAALYGTRAAQSDKILKTIEETISLPGLEAARTLGRAGNYLLSSEQQRVDQAQRDFVNAVLRQESGAVISDAEFANAQRQYFPAPGDDAKVISQKRANRKLAIQGFDKMAGPKGGVKEIMDAPLLPGGPQNEVAGKIGTRLKFDAQGNLIQ